MKKLKKPTHRWLDKPLQTPQPQNNYSMCTIQQHLYPSGSLYGPAVPLKAVTHVVGRAGWHTSLDRTVAGWQGHLISQIALLHVICRDFYRAWILWCFIGLWHGFACFFVPMAALARRSAVSSSGTHATVNSFGTAVMTSVVITVTLRVRGASARIT